MSSGDVSYHYKGKDITKDAPVDLAAGEAAPRRAPLVKKRDGGSIDFGDPVVMAKFAADRADRDEIPKTTMPLPVGDGIEDAALAEWLFEALDRRVLYNHSTEQWHVFDAESGLWREDATKEVQRIVEVKAREAIIVAGRSGQLNEFKLKMLRRLLVNTALEGALVALARHAEYKTDGSDMDADPYLLGCSNGVVDLRTGMLLEPDPARRVSKSTKVTYNDKLTFEEARARAKRFLEFLDEITSKDDELPEFYLRWFGYSLLGHTRAHKFLIMAGRLGRNGKGALKRIMINVFGTEYATEVDRSLYSEQRWVHDSSRPRADLMQLRGLRLAFVSEPEGKFDTNLLKGHTGGDPINARTLHSGSMVTWEPTHTIVFSCNQAPPVSEVGHAIKDRVMVADFVERYVGDAQDADLDDKLKGEDEAILYLLVHYAQAYCAEHKLDMPKRVREASNAYMSANDPTGGFIEAACVLGIDEKIEPKPLFDDYLSWFDERYGGDTERERLSAAKFGIYIGGLFEKRGKPPTWRGIRSKNAMEMAESAPDDLAA